MTLRLLSEDFQWIRLMAFLYDRNLHERNVKQFFHKKEGKTLQNQTLHKLFDDDNKNVTKDEIQSP